MLTLRPEIKVFSRIVGKKGDSLVVAYYAVAHHADGHTEVLKTVYKTVQCGPVAGKLTGATSSTSNTNTHADGAKKVQANSPILALSGTVKKIAYAITAPRPTLSIISSYQPLLFLVSQPTRAPSFSY